MKPLLTAALNLRIKKLNKNRLLIPGIAHMISSTKNKQVATPRDDEVFSNLQDK